LKENDVKEAIYFNRIVLSMYKNVKIVRNNSKVCWEGWCSKVDLNMRARWIKLAVKSKLAIIALAFIVYALSIHAATSHHCGNSHYLLE
jgi:hypothetical protein